MILFQTTSSIRLKNSLELWKKAAPASELIRNYPIWIGYAILDGIYFMRTHQRNYLELLELQKEKYLDQLFFDRPLPRNGGEKLWCPSDYALSYCYRDEQSGVFRYYFAARPCLQAVDLGLRLAWETVEYREVEKHKLKEWVEAITNSRDFIISELGNKEQGEENGKSNIFGIYTIVSAVSNYIRTQSNMPEELPKLDFHPYLNEVLECLRKFAYRGNGSFGFKRQIDGERCLSTTSFGYTILDLIERYAMFGDNPKEYNKLKFREPWGEGQSTLRFLHQCWDEKSCGFRSFPSENSLVNLGHIRYGLRLLRYLISGGYIKREEFPDWLDGSGILRFVRSCWKNIGEFQGFGNVPDDYAPSLCAQRAAANTVKLLEIFRLNSLLKTDDSYNECRDDLMRLLSESYEHLFARHADPKEEVCYAYPRAMIESRPFASVALSTIRGIANLGFQSIRHPLSSVKIDLRSGKVVKT